MIPSSLRGSHTAAIPVAGTVGVVRRRFVTGISLAGLINGIVSLLAPDVSAAPPRVTLAQPVQVQVTKGGMSL